MSCMVKNQQKQWLAAYDGFIAVLSDEQRHASLRRPEDFELVHKNITRAIKDQKMLYRRHTFLLRKAESAARKSEVSHELSTDLIEPKRRS